MWNKQHTPYSYKFAFFLYEPFNPYKYLSKEKLKRLDPERIKRYLEIDRVRFRVENELEIKKEDKPIVKEIMRVDEDFKNDIRKSYPDLFKRLTVKDSKSKKDSKTVK